MNTDRGSQSADNSPMDRSPRRRNSLILVLLGVLLSVLVLVVLTPTILSTPFGRGLVVSAVNKSIQGSVQIDSLDLNWLSGQHIGGLVLLDPRDAQVVRLDELSTELTLLQALRRELVLGHTTVRGLIGEIVVDESGDNNLDQALASTGPVDETSGAVPLPLTANLDLSDASFKVSAPGMNPVSVEDLVATLRLVSPGEPATFELRGKSRQGDMAGQFRISGTARGFFDSERNLDLRKAEGEISADISDLPVDGIDRVLGLQGLLSAGLGERVSLRIDASGTTESQDLVAAAEAPHAAVTFSGRVAAGRFELSQPASIQLDVTPELFAGITQASPDAAPLRLNETFPLDLTLDVLALPVNGFDPGAVSLQGRLAASKPIRFTGAAELGEVEIRDLEAKIVSTNLADRISFTLGGATRTRDKPGQLAARAEIADLFDARGGLQPDQLRMDADIRLSGVPTALIDQLAGQGGLLTDLLGEQIELALQVRSSGADRVDAVLNIDAGPLQAKEIGFTLTEKVTLTQPATFLYTLQPGLLRRMAGPGSTVALKRPALVRVTVGRFEAPRPKAGDSFFRPAETALQASLSSERLELSGGAELGEVRIDALHVDATAESLSELLIDGDAGISEAKGGLLAELNASPLRLRFSGRTGLGGGGALKPITVKLQFVSEGFNGEASLGLDPAFARATVSEPAKLSLLLTPGLLNRLGIAAPGQPMLAKPAPVIIDVTRLTLPLDPFSLEALQASISLGAKELALTGQQSLHGAVLNDMDVSLDFAGQQGAADFKLSAATTLPGQPQPGSLNIDARLKQLLSKGELNVAAAAIDGRLKLEHLPTAIVELISGQEGLVAVIGDSISLDSNVKTGAGAAGTLDLKATSTNLAFDAGFKIGDEITLHRPARANLILTPVGFQALSDGGPDQKGDSTAGYELTENAALSAVITSLRWPLAGTGGDAVFDASRAGVDAALDAPRLSLRDRHTGQRLTLEKLQATLKAARLDKPVAVELTSSVGGESGDAKRSGDAPGLLGVSARASGIIDREGGLNTEGISIDMDGGLQGLPVALLDRLLAFDGAATATLGQSADVTFKASLAEMTGPVHLSLRADHATADVKAQLRQEGLALTEPLVAEVEVTQELGAHVLSNIHPIFETTQSAERPIRLEIPREGVLVPTTEFDISKVLIPRMRMDLGKLTLRSGWLLSGIVGLAEQFGATKETSREQWSAWFTPAVLELRNGRISYVRRLDILLDERFHLATWGTADISGNRADLTLALMPETLEKVFRLPVAAGDALHIPVTGPLNRPRVDYSKAALDLGRLRAQKRLVEKDPLTGALVGAVTGSVLGTGGPLPPASVVPLPWGPLPEPEIPQRDRQPSQSAPPRETEPARPKSSKEQAIESLIDLLRRPK